MSGQNDNRARDLRTIAHVGPFVLFMLFIGFLDLLVTAGFVPTTDGPWYQKNPRLWLYPVQTIACLLALCFWWKHYDFRPHHGWLIAVLAGAIGIAVWIVPGYVFDAMQLDAGWWRYLGFAPRDDGFDPEAVFKIGTTPYLLTVAFRFLRLVVVVPLVEEIFWRGFLMRYIVDPDGDFWNVPFGTFHRHSLVIVTGLFVLIHSPVDYFGALVYGLLTYAVAVKTKSLSACVLMHAVANLILGIYVINTQQWGYW